LKEINKAIILIILIALSLSFLSEAIKSVPKIPIFISSTEGSSGEGPEVPKESEEGGKKSKTSPVMGDVRVNGTCPTTACEGGGSQQENYDVFEIYGYTKTPYIRTYVGESYMSGSWDTSNATVIPFTHKPISYDYISESYEQLTAFYVKPLVPLSGFVPVVLYTSDVSLRNRIDYYRDQLIFYAYGNMEPYTVSYYRRVVDDSVLSDTRLVKDDRYLEVPDTMAGKLKPVAQRIIEGKDSGFDKLKALEAYLKGNYVYDKNYTQAPEGTDPVEWFLFTEKRGVCWQFNSAFVLLARSVGLPARLVVGYLVKAEAEYQVVNSKQAHAYLEVEFEGVGWVLFDATGSGPGENGEESEPRINTVTTIEEQDSACLKGEAFNVAGRVTNLEGSPVNDMKVLVYLKREKGDVGIPCGFGVTVDGEYNVTCEAPINLPVGSYLVDVHAVTNDVYIGSASDPPIVLRAKTFFNVTVPAKVITGRSFEIKGLLQEKESGTAISWATYTLMAQEVRDLKTSERGEVSVMNWLSRPGNFTYTLSWEGTRYYLPAETSHVVWSIPLVITPYDAEKLIRSEKAMISGLVHAQDLAGDGERVNVFKDGALIQTLSTDTMGKFYLTMDIPSNHPLGETSLSYVLESNHFTTTLQVAVYARTRLSLQPVNIGYWYDPLNLTAILRDDMDKPLARMSLTLSYRDQGQPVSVTLSTDEEGKAIFPVKLSSRPGQDSLPFNVSFAGDGFYISKALRGNLAFSPVLDMFSDSLISMVIQFVLPLAAFAALVYYVQKNKITLRRDRKIIEEHVENLEPIAPKERVTLGIIRVKERGVTMTIDTPQIVEPFPYVWGIGDPFTIQVTLRSFEGAPVAGAKVIIECEDGEHDLETGDIGEAEATVSFSRKGVARLRIAYSGTKGEAEAALTMKVVDYREEIIELFNRDLKEITREIERRGENYTAREILEGIIREKPASKHGFMRTMVDVFEEANYSTHPIGRRHYERLYLADKEYLKGV